MAIKIIRGILSEAQAQTELSLEVVKNLRHPFLVQVQGFWVVEDRLVIVMELADSNLAAGCRNASRRNCPASPRWNCLRYSREAADAIDFLQHRRHAIHRDVKPDNLLLDGEGRIKVADLAWSVTKAWSGPP